jgi:hypothetical protein
MLKQVKTELEKYRTDIVAIQDIRWWRSGVLDTWNFILMYSGNESNTFGTDSINKKI